MVQLLLPQGFFVYKAMGFLDALELLDNLEHLEHLEHLELLETLEHLEHLESLYYLKPPPSPHLIFLRILVR